MKNFFGRLSWQMIFATYLAIFFLRNLLMPNVADDLSYKFIWDGAGKGNLVNGIDPNRLQPVESFADILYSQWQHYFAWGGRTVAHTLVQFFVWQEKIFFDAANVFVFAALVLLLFKVGTGLPLREMNKSYLLLIFAGIYFCTPAQIITTIWLTGTCNYLWMCTLEILFLLPFALKYRRKTFWQEPPPWSVPTLALLGLIAGWSSEPGAAVTIFVTFMFLLHFRREKNLQPWMTTGLIFLLIGFAILMLAPGNLHRMDLIGDHLPPSKIQMLYTNFVGGFLPVFLREAVLFVPIIFYFVKAKTAPEVTRFILTFAAGSVLSLAIMMCSPMFPERAGFPSTIFLLVASLAALKEILPIIKIPVKVMIIFAAVWLMSLLGCLYVEYSFHNQIAERMKIVAAHVNDDLIVVPPIKLPDWSETFLGSRTWDKLTLLLGGDLKSYDSNNRNLVFAHIYGLKKIVTAKE